MRHVSATFRFQTPFFGRKTLTRLAMSDFQVQCAAGNHTEVPVPKRREHHRQVRAQLCSAPTVATSVVPRAHFFWMHQILAWSPVQGFFWDALYTYFLIPHPPLAWEPKCHSELMAELDGIFCNRLLYEACSTRLKNSKFRHPLKDATFYCKSFWSVPW